jgi:hypothetical protein
LLILNVLRRFVASISAVPKKVFFFFSNTLKIRGKNFISIYIPLLLHTKCTYIIGTLNQIQKKGPNVKKILMGKYVDKAGMVAY